MHYRWKLKDLEKATKNKYSVFSCFSCGGGSSMGYKLAGFDVVGNVEIDQRMASVYSHNLNPKHSFIMDIKKFNELPKSKLPHELFALDILDGSPPCSTFSMSGKREQKWGKEYRFKEGQKKQRMDTLFFNFIDTVAKLRPKIVLAENVRGILYGNAKGYTAEIIEAFESIGYSGQIFSLNAAHMGVPQTRERVFFIFHQQELRLPKLLLDFREYPISFKEIKDNIPCLFVKKGTLYFNLWKLRKYGDKSYDEIDVRKGGKGSHFSVRLLYDHLVVNTITSAGTRFVRFSSPHHISDREIILSQTFPQDYDFMGLDVKYICGMSVPPVMMAKIAEQIKIQWLDKLEK